jgi:hypothetical protein
MDALAGPAEEVTELAMSAFPRRTDWATAAIARAGLWPCCPLTWQAEAGTTLFLRAEGSDAKLTGCDACTEVTPLAGSWGSSSIASRKRTDLLSGPAAASDEPACPML